TAESDNCFFFSSRRRHTRSDRDWSSDVCSSDLCSPARREPASEQRNGQKQRGDNSERERVSGLNFVEESSHETRQGKRCGDSGTRADEREFEALSNHEGEDVARLRPKRHANAYLLRPLRHGVGQQAIKAD